MDVDNVSVQAVLEEREETHGKFESNSLVSQKIKDSLACGFRYIDLEPFFKEALHAIAAKMARVTSGDPYNIDHWDDIAGYAILAKRYAEKTKV